MTGATDQMRTDAARALGKVVAYKHVGKQAEADKWMAELCRVLGYTLKQPDPTLTDVGRKA